MIGTAVEHVPVLSREVLHYLQVRQGGTYVDCTLGLGGHSEKILERLDNTGQLLALDRDRQTLEETRARLQSRFRNFRAHRENFKNLPMVLHHLEIPELDGCLLDLGVSSPQLDSPERGFSFRLEGPLDMRMDTAQKTTAADLVNELSQERLAEIFRKYGEEKAARRIAAAIVERRRSARFQSTTDLARLIRTVKGPGRGRLHPATRVFQALRIEVNQELSGLETFLRETIGLLAPGGRLVVISFHSLEDRIAKTTFQLESGRCVCFRPADLCTCPRQKRIRILTRRPVRPGEEEVAANPRARSARLRAVERTLENRERRSHAARQARPGPDTPGSRFWSRPGRCPEISKGATSWWTVISSD